MDRKKIFLEFFNKVFSKLKIFSSQITPSSKVHDFIKMIKAYDLGYELIRVGGKNDGGYLIPNVLEKIDVCFSPGVGNSIEFEKELLKFKKNSYLLDGTIDEIPNLPIGINFLKKNLDTYNSNSTITLDTWIEKFYSKNEPKLLLQMDIEGKEYECLNSISDENLSKFNILIIEFHYFNQIFNSFSFNFIQNVFLKLLQKFDIAHIHPNNADIVSNLNGFQIPSALEITFLNKDLVLKKDKVKLPHELDAKNSLKYKNIFLNKSWY